MGSDSLELAKTHGDIMGVPVGTLFTSREQLYQAGVHGRPLWGIHGTEEDGAYAIVLNGIYEEDEDEGETIIYSGHGKGKSDKQKAQDKMLERTNFPRGPQQGDQKWVHGNVALRRSCMTKLPVRVIRGPDGDPRYSPRVQGYRYDGLYDVIQWWEDRNKDNFLICKFLLKRWSNQDPLPNRQTPTKWWEQLPSRQLRKYAMEETPHNAEPIKPHPKLPLSTMKENLARLGRIPKIKSGQ